jgi:hypothetical protein
VLTVPQVASYEGYLVSGARYRTVAVHAAFPSAPYSELIEYQEQRCVKLLTKGPLRCSGCIHLFPGEAPCSTSWLPSLLGGRADLVWSGSIVSIIIV